MAVTKVNPLWGHYAAVGAIALAVLAGGFRYFVLDASDPLKCSSLLTEGQWLDSKYQNWQPEGCMLHSYQPTDVGRCLKSRKVVFAGDSVTRQLFFAFAHLSDPSLPAAPTQDDQKHADYHLDSPESDITFDFLWDPFLNTTKVAGLLENGAGGGSSQETPPALLIIGSGLWYLRYPDSGGLAAWEGKIETTFAAIQNSMPGLADRVIFLPVEEPVVAKLSPERAATIHLGDVEAMNSDLTHRVMSLDSASTIFGPAHLPSYPLALPLALNRMLDPSETKDGIHFSSSVLFKQASLLLNFRCNESLPKKYPFDKTCCNGYPRPPFIQLFLLSAIVALGPLCYLFAPSIIAQKPRVADFLPSPDYLIPITIFGGVIGLNFTADRTYVWLKEQKQFEPWVFSGLCFLAMAAGLGSMESLEKDMGFLSRQQTDEWKGWMQIAILIYHYLHASKIAGIYNPIRVLVASYLWMTGYGHFHFYYKKADYGFLRIAQVMVRLNMLTVVLAYVMDTDYVFYYFAPLVSFWFSIIYGTMVVGSKYNDRTPFIVLKLLASMGTVTYIFKSEWLINALFDVLRNFFAIRWEAREWIFRVTLDLWIVYIGMFVALLTIKFHEHHVTESPRWPTMIKVASGASAIGLVWFFWFEVRQPNKFAYNKWHPYISWIPVLSFIVLRNATPALRSTSSKAFSFVGRCSLETFIMQYHFWLAADTKGVLMVLPLGTAWRTLNMIVSTVGFLYVCHHVAEATGWMTNWVCGTPRKRSLPAPVLTPVAVRAANGAARPDEAIPLMESSSNKNLQSPVAEVVFDAGAHGNGSTSASPISPRATIPPSESNGASRPMVEVPATPTSRPPWLERLAAEQSASPGSQWSPYVATRNRVFGAWEEASTALGLGLGVKGAGILFALWMLNIFWPS